MTRIFNTLLLTITTAFIVWGCRQPNNNKETRQTSYTSVKNTGSVNSVVALAADPQKIEINAMPDSIQVAIFNNTNDTITTGLHYTIEKLEDSEWKEISPEGIPFHDLGWTLKPGDTQSFSESTYANQINYQTGRYRVVKYYLKSDYGKTRETYNVYAEFNIVE